MGDADRAEERLRAAENLDDPLALHTLGYEAETESPPNIEQALKLYRRAAREGYVPSMENLARYYEDKCNSRGYFFWIRKSAAAGSIDSKRELKRPFPYLVMKANKLHSEGMTDEAKRIYKFCSDHGSIDGTINYANMIDLYGSAKSRRFAVSIYTKAMEKGSGLAAFNLAKHFEGRGNLEEYFRYMGISAELGYVPARRKLSKQ